MTIEMKTTDFHIEQKKFIGDITELKAGVWS